jgi:bacillolysin
MVKRKVKSLRFIAAEKSADELAAVDTLVTFSSGEPDVATLANEYLARVLELEAKPMMSFSLESGGEPAPTADVSNIQKSSLTRSSVVRFTQARESIPVFGSDMVVEVDEAGKLVGVRAEIASLEGLSPIPKLDAAEALTRVAAFIGVAPDALAGHAAPTLTFFEVGEDDLDAEPNAEPWHLAWLVADVPFTPRHDAHAEKPVRRAHGPSPRQSNARADILVDAHDGRILFHYSKTPCAFPVVPVRCRGVDALGELREFFGVAVKGGFELTDPQRKIKTFDFALGNIEVPPAELHLPTCPVRDENADFHSISPAAISAHVNVARVWDFYNANLQRNSVDDAGMELISIVNCTSQPAGEEPAEDPREWDNAVWWENRMWYGQMKDKSGNLVSYATCLDIIAHELTHGVTEKTAGLVYQGQSGALNESFSDIMGVIIANCALGNADDVASWNWEIAPGHGMDGGPMRDFRNPKRTGDPDHMKDFLRTRDDFGGVHSNSNIHNKAAYNVLTAVFIICASCACPNAQPLAVPSAASSTWRKCITQQMRTSALGKCGPSKRRISRWESKSRRRAAYA